MIIHNKMVEVIRNALVDYESATGLECQIRYADRLSAVVEVVLELAENVPEMSVGTPIAMKLPDASEVYTTETETENQTETESTESNLHQQIIKMRSDGVKVEVIAKELGISKPTIYEHLDFQRKQEAK